MATPRPTPRYPGALNPTPRSTGRVPRAPIHNPYDKFTQPEFDAWIGDITGALKRALGREDLPPVSLKRPVARLGSEEDDGGLEDSFAEIRARRLAKGKERAHNEDIRGEGDVVSQHEDDGWGEAFGVENYGSSSEEDEDEEAPVERRVEVVDLLSEDEEEEGQEDASGSDDEAAGPALSYDEEEEEVAGAADVYEVGSDEELAEVDEEEGEADQSDAGSQDDADEFGQPLNPFDAHEVTEILDSDEEQEQEEAEPPEPRSIPARFVRKPATLFRSSAPAVEELDGDFEDGSEEEERVDENDEPFPPAGDEQELVDIQDPWRPAAFPEDMYSGGDVVTSSLDHDDPDTLEEEEDELVEDDSLQPPEIHDPWDGPRTYAEDFYAGGDNLPDVVDGLTPSHLTPRDNGTPFIPGVTPASAESPIAALETNDIIVDVNELYADVEEDAVDAEDAQYETARSPSPAKLTQHVDWNWPPAFPGKVATGPGHLENDDQGHEIFEISDDEDVSGAPATRDSPSMPADLYSEFDVFDVDHSDAFEPVNPNGMDFGDLPSSRSDGLQETQVAPIVGSVAPPHPEDNQHADDQDFLAEDAGQNEPQPIALDVAEVPVESEVVIEEFDGDDIPALVPGEDIEVTSVAGDSIEVATIEYSIEEVITEGRLTEEPESVGQAPPDNEPAAETASHNAADSANADATPVIHVHTDLTRDTEYPAPISADPTVPDPASIAPTPASPVSPARSRADSIASSSGGANENALTSFPAHAALLPVFRKMAHAHSPSGLFTPVTNGGSGSVTPEQQIGVNAAVDTDDKPKAWEGSCESVDLVPVPSEDVPSVEVTMVEPVQNVEENADADADANGEDVEATTEALVEEESVEPPAPLEDIAAEENTVADEPEEQPLVVTTSLPEFSPLEASEADVEREHTPGTDVDADADGEVDPDYVPSDDGAAQTSSEAAEEPVAVAVPTDDDPFISKSNEEPVPLSLNKEGVDQAVSTEENGDVLDGAEDSRATVVESEPNTEESHVPAGPDGVLEPTPLAPTESQETIVDEDRDELRPLKRKRKSPPAASTRQLRARPSKSVDMRLSAEPSARKSRKGKGKQRALAESDDEDAASIAQSVTSEETSGSGSSSVAAQQLLIPTSRGSSRASSVVSNAPSTTSGWSQPSPTIMRTLMSNGNDNDNPLSQPRFVHDHGVLRHHHGGRPFAPVIPAPPKRQPSNPPPNLSELSAELPPVQALRRSQSAQPSPPAQPSQLPLSQPASSSRSKHVDPSSSSPVTRANCRYHVISLPRNDKARRIFFAVPGCALGNGDLMKEESIKDHGDVRGDDIPRLVTNVQDLNLSPYLLGILRQLAGVDLLREREVFYLPKPGDNVRIKRSRRSHHVGLTQQDAISAAQRESISARTLSNGGVARSKVPQAAASMAPPSQGSISTSGRSASYTGKLSERGSIATTVSLSGSDLSELEDDDDDRDEDMPSPKRSKTSHSKTEPETGAVSEHELEAAEAAPNGEPSSPPAENGNGDASDSAARRLQPRRSRKLGVDASAYKPDGGESDGSDEEEEDGATHKRRRSTRKRGVKRIRTEDVAAEGAADAKEKGKERDSKPKRRRTARISDKAPVDAGGAPE